ncbi:HEPN domain-containing protein [Candidatus Aminicenantes bacterium AC-708-M15]|jgi:HEPN domain-containing protein|nr:HEPN domain-containing protein [SCandidatus Aminicenantes bacterium Aminicenantia_JdfR_composite]MCP2603897.1 HEPN domain-containing protein [Candidatus Aminicenantes bacterium AC-708-M15]MCP2605709.1 HEPN domain-containing protein [Candidatus Aminicenantes bacterium AC-335-O07]
MNEDAVRKWIKKAESDLKIGKDEIKTENPVTDAVCFHMQQCAEKYLKAYLIFHGEEIRKTHNIAELIEECKQIDSEFQKLFNFDADKLTDYAVEIRYGEEFYMPSIEETNEAIKIAEKVKDFVLNKLKESGFEL